MRPLFRCLPAILVAVLTAAPLAAEDAAPTAGEVIIDYQKSQALRDRLRRAVLHLHVEGAVAPGFDPSLRPLLRGAATLVRTAEGTEYVLTAAPLVRGAGKIEVVAGEGRSTEARFVRELPDEGVAVLALEDRAALGDLAPLSLAGPNGELPVGRIVFSLENLASGSERLIWGDVVAPGEPPLAQLRVVSLKLSWGFPLVDGGARLVGLCFRSVLPTDQRCFASRAADIARALTPTPPPTTPAAPPARGAR